MTGMKSSLMKSNAWLRDPVQREKSMLRSAASSSAIEGIVKPFDESKNAPADRVSVKLPASPKKKVR